MMRTRPLLLATALLTGTLPVAALAQTPAVARTLSAPPAAPVRSVTDDYHGTKVVDPYRYMENLKDPEVESWMKAQAEHTRTTLDALPGRAALIERVREMWTSTPVLVGGLQIVGGRYYTLHLPAGGQQRKLYVRDGVNGTDRLLIDPEKLPGGESGLLAIQWYRPSPDNRYVAYSLAAGGSENGVLHILDTQTGKDLPETADRANWGSATWRADSRSFFYSRLQKLTPEMPTTAKYQNVSTHLHELGRAFDDDLGRAFDDDPVVIGRGASDAMIPLTPDESPYIITRTGSRYAVALIEQGVDRRMRLYAAPVDALTGGTIAWRTVAPSYADEVRDAALRGNTLYWLSLKDAPRGRILALDLSRPDSKPRVVVAEGELPISEVRAGRDALYWRVSDAGINRVHRLRYATGAKPELLRLPYAANITGIITDIASGAVVLGSSSWISFPAYLAVDAQSGRVAETGLQPVGPYDRADDLVVEEVRVPSWDGTRVPLSIVYRKGLALDGSHPAELSGYGAYGISQSPGYDPILRPLYERGVVMATCHVRGGGELGDAWHRAAFQETKPNTWKDFIACAEYLIAHGYTSPQRLSANGGSAGGILVGRAIQERPELFATATAVVPMADMLRYETTANGLPNLPEFGSVRTEAGFRALHAMSPYANVKDGVKYPAVLVTTGINDPRVDAWLAAKFAARMQAATASGKPVLLRVDYNSGHGMGSSDDQAFNLFMDRLSFFLWQIGDQEFQPERVGMAPAQR